MPTTHLVSASCIAGLLVCSVASCSTSETLLDAAGTVFRDCPTCPELVVVPTGTLEMGAEVAFWGDQMLFGGEFLPVRKMTVRTFAMGVHEVTRDEYRQFAEATGRTRPTRCLIGHYLPTWVTQRIPNWPYYDPGYWRRGNRPAVCVSWEDAQAYVRWLSDETDEEYRLPSEVEWEYAARAETTRWHVDRSDGRTRSVSASVPNGFGLHDMLANAWEWVEDCGYGSEDVPIEGIISPIHGNCTVRVRRGDQTRLHRIFETWGRYDAEAERVWSEIQLIDGAVRDAAERVLEDIGYRESYGGFRVARTLRSPCTSEGGVGKPCLPARLW